MYSCNFLQNARSDFCATVNFSGTFVNFWFMMFTQDLMRELARVLNHVPKIISCRVHFKVMFSLCFTCVEKEL